MALIEVPDVHGLFTDRPKAGGEIVQALTKQAWGGTDVIVRDPDGNGLAVVGRARLTPPRSRRSPAPTSAPAARR